MNINHVIFEQFAYHIAKEVDSIKKYGLLSPYELSNKLPDEFHKTSFQFYKDRAEEFLHKSDVNNNDIISYLDNSPKRKPLTSKCLFFAMLPNSDCPYIELYGKEFKIDLDTIQKYSLSNPILVLGKTRKTISWQDLKTNYDAYVKKAYAGAQIKPNTNLKYKYILHFAVECNPIPYKELSNVSYK